MKYKLTNETRIAINGEIVYRIIATEDIPSLGIKMGDKGGFLSTEKTKFGNARVSGNAWVYGDAQVYGDARVYGNAQVYGDAQVSGNARVYGNAQVSGNAQVYGDARVYGNAQVSGNAWVSIGQVDSISAIIVIIVAMKYTITVMRKHIQIGCKVFTRKEAIKNSKKIAKENGFTDEQHEAYRLMIKGARKLVKFK